MTDKNTDLDDFGRMLDHTWKLKRQTGSAVGIYSFKGVKVGLDCANGSSWNIAKSVFDALGADTYVINAQPNGTNINNNAGSTHIEGLQKFVVEKGLDIGFAYLTPEEMRRVDDAVRISLALNPMGSIQQMEPIRRSTAVCAPPEVVNGKPPVYPYTPIRSSFENAGSIEEMMLYTELQSAVHAMIQRLEYSFTFNPSLLTIPKRKQQVAEILEEAEKYIWRIKEEMRCA